MLDSRPLAEARQNLILCNRRSNQPVIFDAQEFGQHLPASSVRLENAYQQLGCFARDAFIADEKNVEYTRRIIAASLSGFDVLARILSFAPQTYAQYCREEDTRPSAVELGQALKDSPETARRFMDLPNDTNRVVEEAFGLRDYSSGLTSNYFHFEDTQRGTLFIADDNLFAKYTRGLYYQEDTPDHWQRCPARRLVTERIWPAMVDLAVATPQVFPEHLAMIDTL